MKQIRDATGRIAFRYTRFEKIRAGIVYGAGPFLLLVTIAFGYAQLGGGGFNAADAFAFAAASLYLFVVCHVRLGEILDYNKMQDDLAKFRATGSSLHLYLDS